MSALICGSLAFDTIMNFEGRFADQILPQNIHILNTSFLVPTLRREWGGCAGNIAYCLQALGGSALPMATVGSDGKDYLARFKNLGISTEFVREVADSYTAQAMIMTDRDNNQIIAFHPGAMMSAHTTRFTGHPDVRIAIIAPDGRDAMLEHAEQLAQAKVPFIFDPGQGLPMFNGAELEHFIELATWVAVNDYEGQMLCERTGLDFATLSQRVQGLVVTLGAQGCDVWEQGEKTHLPPITPLAVIDPTGCGDAFRSALLYGLERGWSLTRCAALGNQLGSIKIAHRGGQNHAFDKAALLEAVVV